MARGAIIFTEEQRNFLLSPAAKALKPAEAKVLRADEAYERFKDVRWGWQSGKPYCPRCGHEKVYERNNRRFFKCAKCGRDFSVTTRTVFASRKLPYETILQAIALRVHDPRNALQSSYTLGVSYKTAWNLAKVLKTFVGNIQPKTREAQWPYLDRPAAARSDGADLIMRVNNVLPRQLPEQVRAEVAQDIIVGVLAGEISEAALAAEVLRYVREHYRRMEWRFDTFSLDQPRPGTDRQSWHEFLSDYKPD